jgi:hypothetical protein
MCTLVHYGRRLNTVVAAIRIKSKEWHGQQQVMSKLACAVLLWCALTCLLLLLVSSLEVMCMVGMFPGMQEVQ